MSKQPLDLRRSVSIIRRLKAVVGVAAAVGLLAGAGYAVLNPPGTSATAIVSLPASVRSTATEVVIAGSYPVLSAASAHVSPHVPVAQLSREVQVKSVTDFLMSITATAGSAAQSEQLANAVAMSFISYVGDPRNPVESVVAEMFQPAVTASAPPRVESLLIAGLLGALAGAIIGSVAALANGRRDRRLRDRDRIASAIGIPVLASVPVGHPIGAAGWASLIEDYQPRAVHAWQLAAVLRYFGVAAPLAAPPGAAVGAGGQGNPGDPVDPIDAIDAIERIDPADEAAAADDGVSLCVVSLSADPGALALGPQLAALAVAQGIPTALVIGPQQDPDGTAALRTACTALAASSRRPALLQIVVGGDADDDQPAAARLTVAVAVVDASAPRLPAGVPATATVLAVSAGRVTADQLARAALAAGANGREVAGILVADPEPTDKTTGRVPQLIRPPRRRMPSRLKGVVTESTR